MSLDKNIEDTVRNAFHDPGVRVYPGGDSRASDLIRWLNSSRVKSGAGDRVYGRPGPESVNNVIMLIDAIRQAGVTLKRSFDKDPQRDFWTKQPLALRRALQRIESLLSPYRTMPTIEILGIDPSVGVGADGTDSLFIDHMLAGTVQLGEQVAVSQLIRLVSSRKFSLLRTCHCGLWFIASRSDTYTCSKRCRERARSQTEAYKAYRAKYHRDYYAKHCSKAARLRDQERARKAK